MEIKTPSTFTVGLVNEEATECPHTSRTTLAYLAKEIFQLIWAGSRTVLGESRVGSLVSSWNGRNWKRYYTEETEQISAFGWSARRFWSWWFRKQENTPWHLRVFIVVLFLLFLLSVDGKQNQLSLRKCS